MIFFLALVLQGMEFKVLQDEEKYSSSARVASVSRTPEARELLILDPQNSPLLEKRYQEFLRSLPESYPTEELLLFVAHFIKFHLFSPTTAQEMLVFLQNWILDPQRKETDFYELSKECWIPVISIEEFIREKNGVCRHYALICAYFLDRLKEEGFLPPGEIYFKHADLTAGRHVWNIFIPSNQKILYQIDAVRLTVKVEDTEQKIRYNDKHVQKTGKAAREPH
jgi:hypothetical protein